MLQNTIGLLSMCTLIVQKYFETVNNTTTSLHQFTNKELITVFTPTIKVRLQTYFQLLLYNLSP